MPARHLPAQVLRLIPGDLARDDDGRVVFPRQVGAAIAEYPGTTSQAIFFAAMQDRGFPLFVEASDNYLTMSDHDASGWRYTAARRGQDRASIQAHRRVCEFANGIICSTPYLAERYADVNENVHLIEPFVDPADWPEPPDRREREVIRVGFAGSPSHRGEIALIAHALSFAAQQPGVEAVMIGFDPGWNFPYRYVPWSNLRDVYRENLGLLDIGLAPQKETPWSQGRSDLKILEYAMMGVAPVASDTESFQSWSGTLPLCANGVEMVSEIKRLLDPDARALQAEIAREHLLAHRTAEANVYRYREAIASA